MADDPNTGDDAAAKAAAEKAEQDRAAAEAAAKAAADDKLGEGGKAALDAERRLRADAEKRAKTAEKAARDAQAKLDDAQAKDLSDAEREKKRADDAEAKLEKAHSLVRQANVVQALTRKNIAHPNAAARLLDGVEFDDDGAPTNLDDRLTAAKAEYGDDMFGEAKAPVANINPGPGGGGPGDAPKVTPEEQQMARASGMSDAEWAHYRDNPSAGVWEPAKT